MEKMAVGLKPVNFFAGNPSYGCGAEYAGERIGVCLLRGQGGGHGEWRGGEEWEWALLRWS